MGYKIAVYVFIGPRPDTVILASGDAFKLIAEQGLVFTSGSRGRGVRTRRSIAKIAYLEGVLGLNLRFFLLARFARSRSY